MAEIRTARLRLVQWTEGTDSPQRVDFNETFQNIENLAAIDMEGPTSERPAPNKKGMYYYATDTATLYRSNGLTWTVVGASVYSQLIRAARADSVSQTISAVENQSSDLQQVVSYSGSILLKIRNNGDLLTGPLSINKASRAIGANDTAPTDSGVTVNPTTNVWGLTSSIASSNTMGLFRGIRGGSTVFRVESDGSVQTPNVTLTQAPPNDNSAVRKLDLSNAVSQALYGLGSSNITGILPVSKGGIGTGNPTSGAFVRVSGDGNSYTFPSPSVVRQAIDASQVGHKHPTEDITGTLPVVQGGTGGTTADSARSNLGAAAQSTSVSAGAGLSGGGTLDASRSLSVVFGGTGTANTSARSDHGHKLTDLDAAGFYPEWTKLPEGFDLNNLTTPGYYVPAYASDGKRERNFPVNNSVCVIQVMVPPDTYKNYVIQKVYVVAGDRTFTRSQWGTQGWLPWSETGRMPTNVAHRTLSGWRSSSEGLVVTPMENGDRKVEAISTLQRSGSALTIPANELVNLGPFAPSDLVPKYNHGYAFVTTNADLRGSEAMVVASMQFNGELRLTSNLASTRIERDDFIRFTMTWIA